MSETKFTPGPWDVRGHWGTFIYCIHDREGQSVRHEENEANIRLVAAAPRLYEAMKRVDALLRDLEDVCLAMPHAKRPRWFRGVQDMLAVTDGALRAVLPKAAVLR